MSQTCATCPAGYFPNADEPDGECRLYPPVFFTERLECQFPKTTRENWCLQRKKIKGESRPKRGKRPISEEDRPTEAHKLLAEQLNINLGAEWGKFKNHCLAHDKRYANFESAFRNWLANPHYQKATR